MTDELICQFHWNESKGHQRFGITKVSNVLFQAVKTLGTTTRLRGAPITKREFKYEMQEVMRATKQRYRNFAKKRLSDHSTDLEEEDSDDSDIENSKEQIEQEMSEDDFDVGLLADDET